MGLVMKGWGAWSRIVRWATGLGIENFWYGYTIQRT
jgi:hypothetical protein